MKISLGAKHDFIRKNGSPNGWQQLEISKIADVIGGATPNTTDSIYWNNGSIPWATPTDITSNNSKYISRTKDRITQAGLDACAAKLLPKGTILFTSRATIGAKAIADVPMATNQGFANFVPREIPGDFLYYLIDILTPIFKRLGSGTTFDEVNKRDIRKVWCAIPIRREEQEAVARILDTMDMVIERTRAAVERVRGIKISLVQQLFEKGLRGEALQKTVVGLIPKSWNVVPVHSVVTEFQYGLSVEMASKGKYPILRMGNIQAGEILLDDLKYIDLPDKIADTYMLKRGDVLFNRTNSQEHVGKVGIYRNDEQAVFASYLIRLFPNDSQIDRYYLGQLLGSYPAQCRIKRYATPGVQQVNVNAKNLGLVLIPVPPGKDGLQEQRDIAAILEQADERIRAYKPVLDTLADLKRALMHDLLTGKVRVNHAIDKILSLEAS